MPGCMLGAVGRPLVVPLLERFQSLWNTENVNRSDFSKLSMSSIRNGSPALWLHVLLGYFITAWSIWVLDRCASRMHILQGYTPLSYGVCGLRTGLPSAGSGRHSPHAHMIHGRRHMRSWMHLRQQHFMRMDTPDRATEDIRPNPAGAFVQL